MAGKANKLRVKKILNRGKMPWNVELSEVGYDPLAMKSRGWEGVGAGNHSAQEGLPADGPLLK